MNSVRMILIGLLLIGLTLFTAMNRHFVPIDLGFQQFDIWLPLVVLISFILGFVPVYLWMSAERMLLKRKIGKLEQGAAQLEGKLSQARVELLQPTAPQPQTVPQPAPPPGT